MFDTLRKASAHISSLPVGGSSGFVDRDDLYKPEDGAWQDFDAYLVAPGRDDRPLPPSSRCTLQLIGTMTIPTRAGTVEKAKLGGTIATVYAGDDEVTMRFEPKVLCTKGKRREVCIRTREYTTLDGPTCFSEFTCTCGQGNCVESHRLTGWNPRMTDNNGNRIPLWNFVASAVKGPLRQPTLGSVLEGMAVPMMISGGFRFGQGRLRHSIG